jgi:hypothetical protein
VSGANHKRVFANQGTEITGVEGEIARSLSRATRVAKKITVKIQGRSVFLLTNPLMGVPIQ